MRTLLRQSKMFKSGSNDWKRMLTGFYMMSRHWVHAETDFAGFKLDSTEGIEAPIIEPTVDMAEVQRLKEEAKKRKKIILEENVVPEGQLSRTLMLGGSIASMASGALFTSLKSKISGEQAEPSLISEKQAEQLALTLCKMRGSALKLGQALASQEDAIIPPVIKKSLERARSLAHAMPSNQLENMLTESWGKNWMSHFETFEEKPFAAASIGQVHRGKLKDHGWVAIKVQYPGVAKSIDSDMDSMKVLLSLVLPKTFFLESFIQNTRMELKEECQYITEMEKQQQYLNLAELHGHDYIKVPKVIEEFSTNTVLTSEFVEGVSLEDVAKASQKLKDITGTLFMRNTFQELFVYEFMQTDPNFGNYLVDSESLKLICMDFGAARSFRTEFCENYLGIILSAANSDNNGILEYGKKLGFFTGFESKDMMNAFLKAIYSVARPFMYQGSFDFGGRNLTKEVYDTLPVLMKHKLKEPPTEVYSLHRKLAGAYLICMKLGARVNMKKILDETVEQRSKGLKLRKNLVK